MKLTNCPAPAELPPLKQGKSAYPNPELMHDQAQFLAELARSIPSDVAQFNHGKLPKDLSEKLKRIEKLSKTLRGELSH